MKILINVNEFPRKTYLNWWFRQKEVCSQKISFQETSFSIIQFTDWKGFIIKSIKFVIPNYFLFLETLAQKQIKYKI